MFCIFHKWICAIQIFPQKARRQTNGVPNLSYWIDLSSLFYFDMFFMFNSKTCLWVKLILCFYLLEPWCLFRSLRLVNSDLELYIYSPIILVTEFTYSNLKSSPRCVLDFKILKAEIWYQILLCIPLVKTGRSSNYVFHGCVHGMYSEQCLFPQCSVVASMIDSLYIHCSINRIK